MQVAVAFEAAEILRKHGMNGLYTLVLRKEFVAAAGLLQRVARINKKTWPLSVHELTAAIFYSLAEKRAERGNRPEGEEWCHRIKEVGVVEEVRMEKWRTQQLRAGTAKKLTI